ncbi:MAG: Ig-like domain-containing protein [Eubacteriales bacterium]|nr:Ig-like domain-containing protein [Eubacteriales bacterium]
MRNIRKRCVCFCLSSMLIFSSIPIPVIADTTESESVIIEEPVDTGESGSGEDLSSESVCALRFVIKKEEEDGTENLLYPEESEVTLSHVEQNEGVQTDSGLIESVYDSAEHTYTFGDLKEGASVAYVIKHDGMQTANGLITLTGGLQTIEVPYIAKTACELYADPISLTIGDQNIDLSTFAHVTEGYDGTISFYTTSNIVQEDGSEERVRSEEIQDDGTTCITMTEGKISAIRTGSQTLYIEAQETDQYSGAVLEVSVTVGIRDLGTLSASDLSWEGTTYEFAGTDTVTLTGSVKDADTVLATVEASVRAESLSAGHLTSTILSYSQVSGTDSYTFTLDQSEGTGPALLVQPKEVPITTLGLSATYGSDAWKSIADGDLPENVTLSNLYLIAAELSTEEQMVLDSLSLDQYMTATIESGEYNVGTTEDAIYLRVNPPEGCVFLFTIENHGSVTILPEQSSSDVDLWNRVAFDSEESTYAFYADEAGTVWIAPGGAATFTVKETEETYDTVYLRSPDLEEESYSSTISIPADAAEGSVTREFYLGIVNTTTRTSASADEITNNRIPDGAVKVDGTAPTISIQGLNMQGTDSTGEGISLENPVAGLYQQTGFKLYASAEDLGSGVSSVAYKVRKIESDTEEIADTIKEESLTDEGWSYADQSESEEDQIEITIPDEEGTYVVLLRAEDHVGNSCVAASDMIVIDQTQPTLSIQDLNEETIYAEDISFTVGAEDEATGIEKITVTATVDEEETTLLSKDYVSGRIVVSELTSAITESVIVPASLNSNKISIKVELTDRAGNTSTEEKVIKIDTTSPSITVSYDPTNEDGVVYYNSARTMTVVVKERNFDPDQTFVTLSVDGTVETMKLTELSGTGIQKISETDSAEGLEPESYSDDRTNTYVFQFGSGSTDSDYQVEFTSTDLAGNTISEEEEKSTKDSFTVDQVAPTVTMSVYRSNGEMISGETSASDPARDRQFFTVYIHVKDRNFSKNLLEFQVQASKADGTEISVSADGNWSSEDEGDEYTYVATLTDDANYTISASGSDLAGNRTSTESVYLTLDGAAPTGSVSITVSDDSVSSSSFAETLRFWLFGRNLATVSISAEDQTSGVQEIAYSVYHPAAGVSGDFQGLTLAMMDSLSWTTLTGSRFTITEESQNIIYVRLRDYNGNVAYIDTNNGVVLDQTNPDDPVISIVNDSGVSDGDVSFSISVKDPTSGSTYSGLASVYWEVVCDGEVTQSGNYNQEFSDRTNRVATTFHQETVDSSLNNSNNIVINVVAIDRSGNRTTASSSLAIDTTAPTVTVSYDDNKPKNGSYFNNVRTMTVTYQERNFDPDRAMITLTVGGETKSVSIGSLSGTGITLVRGRVDSESDKSFGTYTDARTNTYVFAFGSNGTTDEDYIVTPWITDAAGNRNSSVSYGTSNPKTSFTIDEIAPVISFHLLDGNSTTIAASTDSGSPVYDRTSLTPVITIEERNFRDSNIVMHLSGSDAEGNTVSTSTRGSWSGTGNSHVYTIDTIRIDGNYELQVEYTDLAGNYVSSDTIYFTVDRTAPTGSITITADDETARSANFFNRVQYLLFSNAGATIAASATDATSGLLSMQYYLDHPSGKRSGEFSALTAQELEETKWKSWSRSISLEKEEGTIAYLRLEDKAGNVAYINSENGVVLDNTAPAPEISITLEEPTYGIYNEDVPFTITVTDPEQNDSAAGLQSVSWEITVNDKVTQNGDYDSQLGSKSNRIFSLEKTETIDSELNNADEVRIHVTAEDWAGNVAEAAKTIVIDITKPELSITYDNNDAENEFYYNADRTATITVKEHHFYEDGVSITIDAEEKTEVKMGTWKELEGDIHELKIPFSAEDKYTLKVEVEDQAGNKADDTVKDTFVIDKTAPVIRVSYDNNDVSNERYYAAARTATVSITEKSFRTNLAEFTMKEEPEAESQELENLENKEKETRQWKHDGSLHQTELFFGEDGQYEYSISCKDLAGNEAVIYKEDSFIVDTKAPELSITGVEDKSANNGVVEPVIHAADENLDTAALDILLSGINHEEAVPEFTLEEGVLSITATLSDLPYEEDQDDLYTLTATITDFAGNTSECSIQYSVNRFGSVYSFGKETAESLSSYYLQKIDDVVIYETNLDGLIHQGITIGHDGVIKSLKTEEDYAFEELSEETGWKQWKYTIPAKEFKSEGTYEILIQSTDQAGNLQDNSLKEYPIRFAIDKTAPSIVVTGITDGAQYREAEHAFAVNVTDNLSVDSLTIRVGENETTYGMEEIRKNLGKISYAISSTGTWQEVEIKAADSAGNETDPIRLSIFINSNLFLQIYANKPLFYGIIGGTAVLCAAGIGFLAMRKRKRKEK